MKTINHALEEAKDHAPDSAPLEQALITAVQCRVPKGLRESDFRACNEAYARAMETVYRKYSDDLDVTTLFADSVMNLSAWDLWDLKTGEPIFEWSSRGKISPICDSISPSSTAAFSLRC